MKGSFIVADRPPFRLRCPGLFSAGHLKGNANQAGSADHQSRELERNMRFCHACEQLQAPLGRPEVDLCHPDHTSKLHPFQHG